MDTYYQRGYQLISNKADLEETITYSRNEIKTIFRAYLVETKKSPFKMFGLI